MFLRADSWGFADDGRGINNAYQDLIIGLKE
jgi:hypothetical protein